MIFGDTADIQRKKRGRKLKKTTRKCTGANPIQSVAKSCKKCFITKSKPPPGGSASLWKAGRKTITYYASITIRACGSTTAETADIQNFGNFKGVQVAPFLACFRFLFLEKRTKKCYNISNFIICQVLQSAFSMIPFCPTRTKPEINRFFSASVRQKIRKKCRFSGCFQPVQNQNFRK